MHLRSIASTWYEAVMVNSYGAKLENTYYTKRDIQKQSKKQIKEKWNVATMQVNISSCFVTASA